MEPNKDELRRAELRAEIGQIPLEAQTLVDTLRVQPAIDQTLLEYYAATEFRPWRNYFTRFVSGRRLNTLISQASRLGLIEFPTLDNFIRFWIQLKGNPKFVPPAPPKGNWAIATFELGTYDPQKRNLEASFKCPVDLNKGTAQLAELAKRVIDAFLVESEYKIPAFDSNSFGVELGEERYTKERVPTDYSLKVFDYDYNKLRAQAFFKSQIGVDWADRLDDFIKEVEDNTTVFRGQKSGRPTQGQGQQGLV